MPEDFLREKESLEEMVGSEGWKYYVQKIRTEYQGQGYYARMQKAIGLGSKEVKVENEVCRQMLYAITWPQMRINELKNATAPTR